MEGEKGIGGRAGSEPGTERKKKKDGRRARIAKSAESFVSLFFSFFLILPHSIIFFFPSSMIPSPLHASFMTLHHYFPVRPALPRPFPFHHNPLPRQHLSALFLTAYPIDAVLATDKDTSTRRLDTGRQNGVSCLIRLDLHLIHILDENEGLVVPACVYTQMPRRPSKSPFKKQPPPTPPSPPFNTP
jgi:hypothetical protein